MTKPFTIYEKPDGTHVSISVDDPVPEGYKHVVHIVIEQEPKPKPVLKLVGKDDVD